MYYVTHKFLVFPQLDSRICSLVRLVVVQPVIELTLADEDQFSENVNQPQRGIEGGGKLILNRECEKLLQQDYILVLSSFKLTVCYFCNNIITCTPQQNYVGIRLFRSTDSGTPGRS